MHGSGRREDHSIRALPIEHILNSVETSDAMTRHESPRALIRIYCTAPQRVRISHEGFSMAAPHEAEANNREAKGVWHLVILFIGT